MLVSNQTPLVPFNESRGLPATTPWQLSSFFAVLNSNVSQGANALRGRIQTIKSSHIALAIIVTVVSAIVFYVLRTWNTREAQAIRPQVIPDSNEQRATNSPLRHPFQPEIPTSREREVKTKASESTETVARLQEKEELEKFLNLCFKTFKSGDKLELPKSISHLHFCGCQFYPSYEDRIAIARRILESLQKESLPHVKPDQRLQIVILQPGKAFNEWLIVARLIQLGYKQLDIHLIEAYYFPRSELKNGEEIVGQFTQSLQLLGGTGIKVNTYTTKANFYRSFQEYKNKRQLQTIDLVLAIDISVQTYKYCRNDLYRDLLGEDFALANTITCNGDTVVEDDNYRNALQHGKRKHVAMHYYHDRGAGFCTPHAELMRNFNNSMKKLCEDYCVDLDKAMLPSNPK